MLRFRAMEHLCDNHGCRIAPDREACGARRSATGDHGIFFADDCRRTVFFAPPAVGAFQNPLLFDALSEHRAPAPLDPAFGPLPGPSSKIDLTVLLGFVREHFVTRPIRIEA